MQTLPVSWGRAVLRTGLLLVGLLATTTSFAQSSGTGVLTGKIYNSVTQEYVRNAEVRISGSGQTAVSGDGGQFRISNVPVGRVDLVVSYAGYQNVTTSAVVTAGKTTAVDLEFNGRSGTSVGDDGTVVMDAFVVSSEIEGNAKALMEQRNSMNLGRSIASDVFGDVTEGNVGEFLKYLPGIEMEYVEADTRGPRLGGLNPEYTGVSVDGMKQASADGFVQYGATENGSAGGGGRSFSFEQVSINSIESIEISRITPANLDADAPAGTINLRTKRAFDRKGRQIKWSLATGFNSEELTLSATPGPGDGDPTRKFKPIASFNYANSFMQNRLGVLFGVSTSNLYNEQYRAEHTYERTPIPADPRPQVLTQLRFKDGPKWTNRTTYTGTLDFKATEALVLSLSAVVNFYEANFFNRNVDFRASANTTSATNGRQFAGGDGLTTFSTNSTSTGTASNRLVAVSGGSVSKQTDGYTITPKFEWRQGNLLVEGKLSTSSSDNSYASLRKGRAGFGQVNSLTGVQFQATRSDPLSGDWNVVQTGGGDWSNPSLYTNPRMTDDVRSVTDEVNIASLDFTYTMDTRFPLTLKTGAKYREQITTSSRLTDINRWNYVGPGGGTTGSWAAYPSQFEHAPSSLGVSYTSISGGGAPPFADTWAIGELYETNPEYFVNSYTPAQYFNATYADVRDFTEEVPALYAMGIAQFGDLTVQGGLRWEDTDTTSKEFDPLLPSVVKAAGYAVDANGRATTVAGMDYQYTTKPKVDRKGNYDELFPSLALKYRLGENWMFDVGAGHTIRRPEVVKLVGLYAVNEDSEIITTSNPGLLPEYSDRIAANMSYFFGGTNNVTVTLADTVIENLFVSDEVSAEEFGITDPQYAGYLVRSFVNSSDAVSFRSLELSYRQSLDFLPGALQGTSFFANYTRTYADARQPGLTPHVISGGLDWRYRRLGMGIKGVWVDEAPWTSTEGRFRQANVKLDGNIDFRIRSNLTAFMQIRNITNQDHVIIERMGTNVPVIWRRENYGSNYVLGVRGEF